MGKDGYVGGVYTGNRKYTGNISFAQGASGAGLSFIKKDTQIWYVDSGKTSPSISGDGLTWETAFVTLAEAVTAAGDHDTILVAPNDIETIDAAGIDITQEGLRIIGSASSQGGQNTAFKCTGTAAMFRILADRVEIAGIYMSQRGAYPTIEIGSASVGAVYETHIHDCNFDGYGTATYGVTGYNQTVDTVSMVVEDNYLMSFATIALHCNGTRDTYRRNTIIVPTSTTGIYVKVDTGDRPFTVIVDNYLVGITDAVGIEFAGTPTAGTLMLARNYLGGTWGTSITDVGAGVMNYVTNATGGVLINC